MRSRMVGHSLEMKSVRWALRSFAGGARGDEHADAALDDDEAFVLETLIGFGDRQRVGALFGGQAPGPREAGRRRYSGRRESRRQ